MNMNLPVVRSPLLQGDFFSLLFPQLCISESNPGIRVVPEALTPE